MNSGYDPFAPQSGDPFGTPPPPPVTYGGQPAGSPGFAMPPGQPTRGYNTFAVLAPILAVIVPPAGVVLGHIALPQIERSHEQGRAAAISALVLGYLMCVVLIASGLWWVTRSETSTTATTSTTSSPVTSAAPSSPSVVTSIAPPSNVPRVKLDLATVALGTCVQIQVRSTNRPDALDLYRADCRHNAAVYTVAARVGSSAQCTSDFAAAPPDLSFALCLNPY